MITGMCLLEKGGVDSWLEYVSVSISAESLSLSICRVPERDGPCRFLEVRATVEAVQAPEQLIIRPPGTETSRPLQTSPESMFKQMPLVDSKTPYKAVLQVHTACFPLKGHFSWRV